MRYVVKLFGSAGTRPLEWEDSYTVASSAVRDVEALLPTYWPIYYSAAVWKIERDGSTTLVAEFKSNVKVERIVQ